MSHLQSCLPSCVSEDCWLHGWCYRLFDTNTGSCSDFLHLTSTIVVKSLDRKRTSCQSFQLRGTPEGSCFSLSKKYFGLLSVTSARGLWSSGMTQWTCEYTLRCKRLSPYKAHCSVSMGSYSGHFLPPTRPNSLKSSDSQKKFSKSSLQDHQPGPRILHSRPGVFQW